MNKEIIDEIKPLMADVANKIGETAEWSWEVILRQQIANGIVYIILTIVSFIVFLIAIKKLKESWNIIDDDPGLIIPLIFLATIPFASAIIFLILAVLYLVNPEYYALQFFINLIK